MGILNFLQARRGKHIVFAFLSEYQPNIRNI